MNSSLQMCCTEKLNSTVQMFFHAQINFAQPQQSYDHFKTLKKPLTHLIKNGRNDDDIDFFGFKHLAPALSGWHRMKN